MTIYGLAAIAAAFAAFSIYYRRKRVSDAALLVHQYGGSVSSSGDTVRFKYRGAPLEIRRIASGGGMAGTGSYSAIVMPLKHGMKISFCPTDAANYLYALFVPAEHTVILTGSKKLLMIGPGHRATAPAVERLAASGLFDRLFSRPFSTLQVKRDLWTLGRWPPRREWSLQLTGLPVATYQQPQALQPVLDGLLTLAAAIGAVEGEGHEHLD